MDEGTAPDGKPFLHVETRAELRGWLDEHCSSLDGRWLVTWKKPTGKPRPSYDDIVEELLCFGWIDSRSGTLDADRGMLWIAPRKPRSAWSRVNKERIERLLAMGMMTPAGQAVIDAAQRSGTWTALDEVEDGVIPDDLAAAFSAHAPAAEHWESFSRSSRRAILEWINQAKRPETRAGRVAETARLAAVGEKANQWTRKT